MMNKSILIVFSLFIISVVLTTDVRHSDSHLDTVASRKTPSDASVACLESESTKSCNLKKQAKRLLEDTAAPTTAAPTTAAPTTAAPTTAAPTTAAPTTAAPTTAAPTTAAPTTAAPSTAAPTTAAPTTAAPSTAAPSTTGIPTTASPSTTEKPTTTAAPSTSAPSTAAPSTAAPTTTGIPTTASPSTTEKPTTAAPSNKDYSFTFSICATTLTTPESTNPNTDSPTTTGTPATGEPTTSAPSTVSPSTVAPSTTVKPSTAAPTTTEKPSTVAPTTTEKPSTVAPTTTAAPSTATPTTTVKPSTVAPSTTGIPTTASPSTTEKPTTTAAPSTVAPSTTASPSTVAPSTTEKPTTAAPSTSAPTTAVPSTAAPTTAKPSTAAPSTTEKPTTAAPTTAAPTTAKPSTAAPTTEKPTTTAPTTAKPSTVAPSTAAPTTEKPTTIAPTTAAPSTAAPTTAKPSTAAPTTAAPTTATPAARLLLENDEIKSIVNSTLYTFYTSNEVNPINYNTEILETADKINVQVTLTVIPSEISKADDIESALKNGSSSYFGVISNETNGEYGKCDEIPTTPGTIIKSKTQCSYITKKVFITGHAAKPISPSSTDTVTYEITYSSNCNELTINTTTGVFTVPIDDKTTNYKTCKITCTGPSDTHEPTTVTFQYIVTDYTYSVDLLLSKFPYIIYPNEAFETSLALSYPIVEEIDDNELTKEEMTISLTINENNEYVLENLPINVEGTTYFDYKNVKITTDKTSDGKINLIFMNGTNTIYTKKDITMIGTTTAAECEKDERDPMGLCCDEMPAVGGLMCKNFTLILPFVEEVTPTLFDAYNKLFKKVFFNNTNYIWYSEIEEVHKLSIVVHINIGNDTVIYSEDETTTTTTSNDNDNNNNVRELDGEPEFINYDYVKVLASLLESTDETEIQQKIESLPAELRQQIQKKVSTEIIKQSITEVAVVMQEEGNSIDMNIGITSEYDYVPPMAHNDDNKSWAEKYWYVILIICLVVVILLVVIALVAYSFLTTNTINKYEKNEKIMETVIPIEKIKQENGVTEDSIYKPFSYEVIMEGYLLKEGHDRVIGKFQRRYCVLYFEPAILRIYDSMVPSYYGKVYLDEKQSIPLECYSGIEYSDGSNEFTLVLKVTDSTIKTFVPGDVEKRIHLKVEGENGVETAKKWVECFRDFKSQKPKAADAWTKPLIIDGNNGKISTSTNKQFEKKNEEIIARAQQRKQQAKANIQNSKTPYE